MYTKMELVVSHLDSMPGTNSKQTKEFGNKMFTFFCSPKHRLIEQPCLRQNNGNTENVIDYLIKHNELEVFPIFNENVVNNFRDLQIFYFEV